MANTRQLWRVLAMVMVFWFWFWFWGLLGSYLLDADDVAVDAAVVFVPDIELHVLSGAIAMGEVPGIFGC